MKNRFLIIVAVAALLASCNQSNNNQTTENKKLSTTLKLNWIFTGSFAPEAYAKDKFASTHNLDLTIEAGGLGKDPLKLVGDNEFGTAAADEVLRANDKGGDFVIIGLINYNSPACFISQQEKNIQTPKDLEGKTVGILPFGSTGLIYKIMLKKNNVDQSKIKEITVYPDLKIFLSGKSHDVQPAFIYDETVSLDLEGIKYNVLEPKSLGVLFHGPCYFTTRTTVEKNPELVQAFINTMADGVNGAIKSPSEAIKSLKKLSADVNEARELKVWEKGIEYYKGYNDKPLTSDMDSWNEMVKELMEFKEIKTASDLNKALNFSFIDKYYSAK